MKLTQEQAIEIREWYARGETSYQKLANEFKVDRSTIRRIVNYQARVEVLDILKLRGFRQCSRCRKIDLEENFSFRNKKLKIYSSYCKKCSSIIVMETRDPIKRRATQRRYAKTEKAKIKNRKRNKIRYDSNPEYYISKRLSHKLQTPIDIFKKVRERDKICQLCGSDQKLEFDHIFPASEGGKGTLENLQLLCRRCNMFKFNHFFLPGGGMMKNDH